jgi:hypothetical protein
MSNDWKGAAFLARGTDCRLMEMRTYPYRRELRSLGDGSLPCAGVAFCGAVLVVAGCCHDRCRKQPQCRSIPAVEIATDHSRSISPRSVQRVTITGDPSNDKKYRGESALSRPPGMLKTPGKQRKTPSQSGVEPARIQTKSGLNEPEARATVRWLGKISATQPWPCA